ncbi:double-strand break repair protein AddB [Hyphomicrobium methylovorum]|uniref:double-strand break repair protein AddB n=1 Tax=Hyphomicrobium methylovorum TaxID=84 RepID=UPI0015E721F8|nr:double-strand break repair protein AddB [Hyphomicrobium methylovorum]MBA2125555.1 double-strand break repair protein AddB [Hyphomicrobium methylovorum]
MTRNVFTLPPGVPFLRALADAILSGNLPSAGGARPEALALPNITLLLPTQRAVRAAREAFLAAAGGEAIIMPRIRAISKGDEDLSLISSLSDDDTGLGAAALEQPPAIDPMDRTLLLMQLVARWRDGLDADTDGGRVSGSTPAQAAQLAAELGGLMDNLERENVSLSGIQSLVPDTHSKHWQKTVDFLKIVTEWWPLHLASAGLMSPEARRNASIQAEAERIATSKRDDAVIVAGVTGSIPATVSLMRAVVERRNGAIVLPALDQTLDEESWQAIAMHPEHPQFGLKKLIDALGVARGEIETLPGIKIGIKAQKRTEFFNEAMRPAATTEKWHDYIANADQTEIESALSGVSLINAPSAQDEAEAVALILREAVETPGRTAALVSPDRVLARRVAVRLESWGIRVDDSAGRPFAKTVPGAFLSLVLDAVVSDFAPAETMALLRHPLCRAGLKPFDIRKFARALEISAFRAPYLGRGLDGIRAALDNAESQRFDGQRLHRAAQRLWPDDRNGARDLIVRLTAAFEPLTALYAERGERPLSDFARAHAQAAESLAALPDDEVTSPEDGNPLWQKEAGDAASTFFAKILLPETPSVEISAADYADLYATLLARENVRERGNFIHPRVSVWGPFEARMQQPDVLILGSLNEGTWPEPSDPGAWLNRPMRDELGMPSPEEASGRAAHDFVSLLGAETVYLTRAEKVDGVPTVPSRWLMRVSALLSGVGLSKLLDADGRWLQWARARDRIDAARRIEISPPSPVPDVALRPRRMSVTQIERWTANPYAIYAQKILELDPLPPLGDSPDASLRGRLVHDVLARFAKAHPTVLPADPAGELTTIAMDLLKEYTGHTRIAAFWMPRLKRFLTWFAEGEAARRENVRTVIVETNGSLVLPLGADKFTLTARADRIDDIGTALVITDYKTGAIPSDSAVAEGRSPQLPLEAAIALQGSGFENIPGNAIAALRYIRAHGGEPPGEERIVKGDAEALAKEALAGLERLIAKFADPATPYLAVRRPGYNYMYDEYAHLARVAEWSAHVEAEATS